MGKRIIIHQPAHHLILVRIFNLKRLGSIIAILAELKYYLRKYTAFATNHTGPGLPGHKPFLTISCDVAHLVVPTVYGRNLMKSKKVAD